jgi:uncharacterized protein (DUF1697 family)
MAKYVALLRAINVAGHPRVTMDRLRKAFDAAGCRNVRTCIQSGNVIFESSTRSPGAITASLVAQLRSLLGTEPGIVPRSFGEVEELVRRAPFQGVEAGKDVKLYVVFLFGPPRAKPRFPLVSPKEALEALGMAGLEVFVVSRRRQNGGFGFPNNFIEAELGVAATARNWSTVSKLVALGAAVTEPRNAR